MNEAYEIVDKAYHDAEFAVSEALAANASDAKYFKAIGYRDALHDLREVLRRGGNR